MKIKEAIRIEELAHIRRMKLRSKKAHDYAKEDEDCLSNFKVIADIQAALKKHGYAIPIDTAYGTAIWHAFHKLVRLLNLWNEKKEPENESLEDTYDDLANYIDLSKECYTDYVEEKKE